MFEHAVYAVISPEGCASILWRTADKAPDAAEAMKVTAQDLKGLGVIDTIVTEPLGGAHRDPDKAITALGDAMADALGGLHNMSPEQLKLDRRDKFLAMGRL
jgi:acetyl-CoA carboxylase carboxyl transferase subunit alpha